MDYKKYHRDKTYQENDSHFKNIFRKRVNIVLKYIKKGRVLDVGASTGAMLDIFKEKGFETWGVEPSLSSSIAKKKGHKIIFNYFEKAKLPSDYFDAVIMNHTLEHLNNPVAILVKIHKLLKS